MSITAIVDRLVKQAAVGLVAPVPGATPDPKLNVAPSPNAPGAQPVTQPVPAAQPKPAAAAAPVAKPTDPAPDWGAKVRGWANLAGAFPFVGNTVKGLGTAAAQVVSGNTPGGSAATPVQPVAPAKEQVTPAAAEQPNQKATGWDWRGVLQDTIGKLDPTRMPDNALADLAQTNPALAAQHLAHQDKVNPAAAAKMREQMKEDVARGQSPVLNVGLNVADAASQLPVVGGAAKAVGMAAKQVAKNQFDQKAMAGAAEQAKQFNVNSKTVAENVQNGGIFDWIKSNPAALLVPAGLIATLFGGNVGKVLGVLAMAGGGYNLFNRYKGMTSPEGTKAIQDYVTKASDPNNAAMRDLSKLEQNGYTPEQAGAIRDYLALQQFGWTKSMADKQVESQANQVAQTLVGPAQQAG
jgi:hypothetical protein